MVEVVTATVVPRVKQVPAAKPAAPLAKVVAKVGIPGKDGEWKVDRAFLLRQLSLPIVDGVVRIDLSKGNTFYLLLSEDVHRIVYDNAPPTGITVRVQVYVDQDHVGGRMLEGWPSNTFTGGGIAPNFGYDPHNRDSFVLDTFDGGETVHLNLVGLSYRPIT